MTTIKTALRIKSTQQDSLAYDLIDFRCISQEKYYEMTCILQSDPTHPTPPPYQSKWCVPPPKNANKRRDPHFPFHCLTSAQRYIGQAVRRERQRFSHVSIFCFGSQFALASRSNECSSIPEDIA